MKKGESNLNWIDRFIGSNAFRTIIKGAYWGCIAIALLFLFMIGSFLFKIYVLDYRFDDGELHPPIEASIYEKLSSMNSVSPKLSFVRMKINGKY
ncbi:hypothetical protein [Ureibacillus massiliensis]|uniref:hypothetical protein n=1 Tax=Ureibacillus massiliensis TaxID=292806 RepID=UPI001130AF9F|nr:hypothetical protein [Ureibacillus massiliensis]